MAHVALLLLELGPFLARSRLTGSTDPQVSVPRRMRDRVFYLTVLGAGEPTLAYHRTQLSPFPSLLFLLCHSAPFLCTKDPSPSSYHPSLSRSLFMLWVHTEQKPQRPEARAADFSGLMVTAGWRWRGRSRGRGRRWQVTGPLPESCSWHSPPGLGDSAPLRCLPGH